MSKVLKEEIVCVERLAPLIYRMVVKSGYVAQNARPGQFVNVKCCEGIDALLRRPISICSVDRNNGTFDIVFQVKGIGTGFLSQKRPGDRVDLIGPLGKPFDISESYRKIAVVGGGIGIFPLLYVLKEKAPGGKSAFIGFRSKDNVVLEKEFSREANKLFISTDDGSYGHKGLITDLFEESLSRECYDIVYACGPVPMLKKVAGLAEEKGIKCQVSLEQRMGCGIGACLVCACKTRSGEEWEYRHVCKDGPVFWSSEVVFDE